MTPTRKQKQLKTTRMVKGQHTHGPYFYVTYYTQDQDGNKVRKAIRCRNKEHQMQVFHEISKIRECYKWRLLNCTLPKNDVRIFDAINYLPDSTLGLK